MLDQAAEGARHGERERADAQGELGPREPPLGEKLVDVDVEVLPGQRRRRI
jgi:hypothetical protein